MDVAGRAEAIRQRAVVGTWEDVPALINTATTEKSPSVRHLAAVAANTILVRMRGGLTVDQRTQLVQWSVPLDPGLNPALLLALAPAESLALDRLGRMLRDGRTEVRTGATAVARQMLLSRWCREPEAIEERLAQWLTTRLAPDAAADLIRLVGEAGLTALRPLVSRLPSTGNSHLEILEECLGRLHEVAATAGWDGWWVPDARDVLEEAEEHLDVGASWWIADGSVPGRTDRAGLRRVFAQQAGVGGKSAAILGEGRVFWRQSETAGSQLAELEIDRIPVQVAAGLANHLTGRVRAMCLVVAGRPGEAVEGLRAAAQEKRGKPDSAWWLARALLATGDPAGARSAARDYLDRAGKKASYRNSAETLVSSGTE